MSWFFYALLSAIFAALTAVFAKAGLQGIDSGFATFIRTVLVVGIVALWLSFLGKWQPFSQVSMHQWLFLVLSAVATGFSWLFYFKALQLGQAPHVVSIDKLSVVFVSLFSLLFFGVRLGAREWLGIVLIVLGVVCIALKPAGSAAVSAAAAREVRNE